MRFSEQTAIISGGLGDIGRAIAERLASEGADVALGDLRPAAQAQAVLASLRAHGVKARYDRVDVANPRAVTGWVARVSQRLGTPTLIIPNAAIVTGGSALAMSAAAWRRELAVNLDGAFFLAQAGAQGLLARAAPARRRCPGRIVFIGSWAGHAPHPGIPAYSTAKAGLRMVMQCLALELGHHGILVNEVAPGYVDAGLSGKWFRRQPADRERARSRVPIQTLLTAADVALQVAHLCDPANTQITGQVVVQDGGLSLVGPASIRWVEPAARRSRGRGRK